MSRTKKCISLLLVFFLMLGHLSPMALATEDHLAAGEIAVESAEELSDFSELLMSGTCGEALTWELSYDGTLTISGIGEMTDFTVDSPAPWSDYCNMLWSVVLGDGVTSVGDRAFSGCVYLGEVRFGDDVETIGSEAFLDCVSLLSTYLNNQLSRIEARAFKNSGLYHIRLSDKLTSIGEEAFAFCKALKAVEFGWGISTIGAHAFSGCSAMEEIAFPSNIEEIENFAFENCTGLRKIWFYGEAPSFGEEAFKNVTATVFYPDDDDSWIPHISQGYGGNLAWLVERNCWEVGHTYEAVVKEATCDEEGYTTYTCVYCGDYYTDGHVQPFGHNFVDGVCTNCSLIWEILSEGQIDDGVAWELDSLGTLTISGSGYLSGFSKPGDAPWYAYKNKIRTVVIENGILSIGYNAFYNYTYLEKVEIARSVGSIGSEAFYSCRSLRDIVFDGPPPNIAWSAFYNVTATATYPSDGGWTDEHLLEYSGKITWVEKQICDPAEHAYEAVVTEPSCTEMGCTTHICTICDRSYVEEYTNALGHCFADGECTACGITETIIAQGMCGENMVWKLTDDGLLDISGTGEMTDAPWVAYKDRITCAVIHDGVTSVAERAFSNCALLESVAIPESVTEFHASFEQCANLRVVIFPDSAATCCVFFQGCINLEHVELPQGITQIGSWAFADCRKLESFEIPDTVTVIESDAFRRCGIQEIRIPEGVQTIEEYTFIGCFNVKEIIIPNTVTAVGEGAFWGCNALRKAVIAGDEVTFDRGIFKECAALEEIWFEGVRPVFLSYDMFNSCEATVYFHGRDCTWQEMINHDFGGARLTWVNLDDVLAEHVLEHYAFKEPTCTESGYESYDICTVCERTIPGYVELPARGHYYVQTYSEPPTCTKEGRTIWTCNRCGDSKSQYDRPPLGHSYEGVVTEPTCTEDGYTTYTCSVCGHVHVADHTKALGHSYEIVVNKEAALFEDGKLTYTCTTCAYSYTKIVPAHLQYKVREDHVEITSYTGDDTELVIPSELKGLPVTKIANRAFSQRTSLIGITIPDSITSISDRAFEECTGLTTINFVGDPPAFGQNVFYHVEATAYYPGGNPNWNADVMKNHGGWITWVPQTHEYTAVVIAPTCTEDGCTIYTCAVCGKSYVGDRTEALGHNYHVVIDHGEQTYTCKTCGESYTKVVEAKLHCRVYNDHVEIVGCDDSAWHLLIPDEIRGLPVTRICERAFSEKNLESIVIPDSVTYIGDYAFYYCYFLTGVLLPRGITSIGSHTFAGCSRLERIYIPADVTSICDYAFGSCNRLEVIHFEGDAPEIAQYAFSSVEATACYPENNSSWTEDVKKNYGGRITWVSHNHKYNVIVSEPACEESGYVTYSCSICGDTYVVSEILPIGHSDERVVTAPTCTEKGYTTYICTRCGRSYVRDYTAPIGHHSYELVATEGDHRIYSCTTCNDSYVESISTGLRYMVCGDHVEIAGYIDKNTEIVIPDEIRGLPVTKIRSGVFSKSRLLISVVIPDSVTAIGLAAFRDCPNLTSIELPNGITAIADETFYNCSRLTGISIPEGVTSIAANAFYNCTGLTSISIPEGVTSIAVNAFYGCTSLTGIHVNRNNQNYSSDDRGVLFNKAKTRLIQAPCGIAGSYVVPNGVISIDDRAFRACSSLTSVSIPDCVTSIGSYAFIDCSSLNSIALSDGITRIGSGVFRNCSGLTSIELPDSIESIDGDAFYGCSSLTGIDIPSSVTSIGSSAFYGCSSLADIDIPNTVTSIGSFAFYDCSSLTSIDIPDGVTSIKNWTFYGCSGLTGVVIPEGVTSIGAYAFRGCKNLVSVDLSGNLSLVDNFAFYKCVSLTAFSFDSDAPTLGSEVFGEVTATVYYPAGNRSWNEAVMQNYGGTITWEAFEKPFGYVVYTDHVEITAYYGDDTKVVIPTEIEGLPVTAIGCNAFADCSGLTSIEIPGSVTSIGDGAFSGCGSLISICFNGDAPIFGREIFLDVAATGYYPAENTTWTDDVKHNYGGSITWEGYAPCAHEYTAIVSPATCTEQGYTTYICSICENTYILYGSGQRGHKYVFETVREAGIEDGEVILTCTTCGYSCTRIIPAYLQYALYADHAEITGFVGKPTEVVIPAEIEGLPVTVIGDSAFYNCDEINTVSIPDSVTVIGNSAFHECSYLTSIVIPDSVTSIGVSAFEFCDRLISITLPTGITEIADHTFEHCWDLRRISIPNRVTSIGDYAFYGSGLRSITIPRSVTHIGKCAFEMCSGIMTVEFEDGITSIENGVLSNCKELSAIRFKGDAPAFSQNSFEEVTAIAYYPASNPTWTADVMQDYGGTIAWVPYGNKKLSFTDVSEGSFFYEPVAWAVAKSITSGTSATTFGPYDQCMRAHVVTFLWRAVGSPEPTQTDNPFVDVKPRDFYYKPVLWALENGITAGLDATHFGPTAYCNRAQVVTFLYRTMGNPDVGAAANPFTDVASGSFYEKAVLWAVENGVTAGLSATSFGPNSICNRAQIVTFLYRAFVND